MQPVLHLALFSEHSLHGSQPWETRPTALWRAAGVPGPHRAEAKGSSCGDLECGVLGRQQDWEDPGCWEVRMSLLLHEKGEGGTQSSLRSLA